MLTRANICALFDWSVDTFKGMQRHNHLPLDANESGWTRFSALDAVKIAMALSLANDDGLSRTTSAAVIRDAALAIESRWAEIVESGIALFEGRYTEEFLAGRARFPIGTDSMGVCFRSDEPVKFAVPPASFIANNISRAVAVIMIRAARLDMEIDWKA